MFRVKPARHSEQYTNPLNTPDVYSESRIFPTDNVVPRDEKICVFNSLFVFRRLLFLQRSTTILYVYLKRRDVILILHYIKMYASSGWTEWRHVANEEINKSKVHGVLNSRRNVKKNPKNRFLDRTTVRTRSFNFAKYRESMFMTCFDEWKHF